MPPRRKWPALLSLIVALALSQRAPLSGALACCSRRDPSPAASHVEIIAGPAGEDLKTAVQREVTRAKADGRDLLVYVGATWCEPCQRFHKAAEAGELDKVFPTLRLIEFDLDRDRDRLDQAGYRSRMIPLFAVPRADGTGSQQQIEGSIKGPGAVDEITPKLRGLLSRARTSG